MVKTIIFDLGNVLVKVDEQRPVLRLKKQYPEIQERDIFSVFDHSDLAVNSQKGLISPTAFYEGFRDAVGIDFSFEYFKSVWQDMFSPIQPMIEILPQLESEYGLILLSNTDVLHIEYIRETYSFFHHFNHVE